MTTTEMTTTAFCTSETKIPATPTTTTTPRSQPTKILNTVGAYHRSPPLTKGQRWPLATRATGGDGDDRNHTQTRLRPLRPAIPTIVPTGTLQDLQLLGVAHDGGAARHRLRSGIIVTSRSPLPE